MIPETLTQYKIQFRDWFSERAHGTYAKSWLALIAFFESWIFPIPTVVFLIAILMAGASRWVYFATLATLFSVLGGIFGYVLGFLFFDSFGTFLITTFHLAEEFESVQNLYNTYAFWAVLVGAFTPLPFKVFALSAGFLKINPIAFILASILGRALQFFAVAFGVKLFGGRIAQLIFDYFTIIVFVAALLLGILILL